MAHTLGPCRRAKRWAKLSGSALMMKLMPPWRYSVTFLWRCLATGLKPMCSNSAPMAAGSGAAYSMNSKPSVPMGLSQGVLGSMAAEGALMGVSGKFVKQGKDATVGSRVVSFPALCCTLFLKIAGKLRHHGKHRTRQARSADFAQPAGRRPGHLRPDRRGGQPLAQCGAAPRQAVGGQRRDRPLCRFGQAC